MGSFPLRLAITRLSFSRRYIFSALSEDKLIIPEREKGERE
jgi:hypothetical protein